MESVLWIYKHHKRDSLQVEDINTFFHHIYDDLASQYTDQIEPKVAGLDAGELAQFLTNYMKHV